MKPDLDEVSTLSAMDRFTIGASRAMTRRRFVQSAMRWGVGAGVALATPLQFFLSPAGAANCNPGGFVSDWGCNCAGTAACASSKCCNGNCCNGYRTRCDHWRTANVEGNYCWCSQNCCQSGGTGYWVCCDCWTGGSGGCATAGGASKCICKTRLTFGIC